MIKTETKAALIENRIAVLRERTAKDNGSIIRKLERKLRNINK